jgi:hypothetical protein
MQSSYTPHDIILMLNNQLISSWIQSCPLIYNNAHWDHQGTNTLYKTSMYNNHLISSLFDHDRRFFLSHRDHLGAKTLNTISMHNNRSIISSFDLVHRSVIHLSGPSRYQTFNSTPSHNKRSICPPFNIYCQSVIMFIGTTGNLKKSTPPQPSYC